MFMTTTYRHDYKPPKTNRYRFLEKNTMEPPCSCPKEDFQKLSTSECPQPEWTGVAPMGKLVAPRLIPTKLDYTSKEEVKLANCQEEQPNRFLKSLKECYPDLYERLLALPQEDLRKNIHSNRLMSTYQIDFCKLREFDEGLYKTAVDKDDKNKHLLTLTSGCETFRNRIASEVKKQRDISNLECVRAYRPKKFNFSDSAKFNSVAETSHWSAPNLGKTYTFSEYMDGVSKTGCVILQNDIHVHDKCTKESCNHQLKKCKFNELLKGTHNKKNQPEKKLTC